MIRSLVLAALAMSAVSAFAPPKAQPRVEVKLCAEVDRRTILGTFGAVLLSATPVLALDRIPADNEILKEQRTVVGRLDINNAPVADYMQLPGMYPTIGGKIANSGPFASVKDIYKVKGLSADEKAVIKKYEKELVATRATGLDPMRGRDPYRSSFNQMATVRSE